MSSSADSSSADHDPVRSSPPEDPWLTEAPTSALGETPAPDHPPPADTARFADPPPVGDPPADTAQFVDGTPFDGPPADTARFADAAPFGNQPADAAGFVDPAPFGDPVPPQGRRGRRATRWVVAVLAAVAVFIAGMLATDQFGSGADDNRDGLGAGPSTGPGNATSALTAAPSGGPTTVPAGDNPVAPVGGPIAASDGSPTAASGGDPAGGPPSASRPADSTGGPLVIYEVTASGSDNIGSVDYTDQDGDIIRRNGIKLPWRVTFRLGGQRKPPLVLISQRKGGGDAGPVTCSITLDGKVLSSTTAEGRYAAPQCSG